MTTTTRLGTTNATPDWDSALCAQTDPALFFPEGMGAQITIQVKQAKAICGRCPIRDGCLQWALETRQPVGIWGGMDEKERRQALGTELVQSEVCWEQQGWIEEQLAAGVSQRRVCDELGVSRMTLARCIAQFETERAVTAAGAGVKA
jgi:WhiB family redox-sensing transcriptional regulator